MVHINLIIKIKDYKLSFVNKDSLLFNILCNSYCEFEDFVVKTDLERHGLELSSLKNEIKNSDKTLWTKLKIINEYLALTELIDTYYISKLKEYPNLIKLFSEGRYKDNYMKDNIFADKILIVIGIKKMSNC